MKEQRWVTGPALEVMLAAARTGDLVVPEVANGVFKEGDEVLLHRSAGAGSADGVLIVQTLNGKPHYRIMRADGHVQWRYWNHVTAWRRPQPKD